jgi:anthranilate phosphoribosyltransferase
MLVGVPRPELCEPLAHVLQSLGVRRAMVVCGKSVSAAGFLDELSTLGENTIAEFYQERGFTSSGTALEQFPLQPATLADLLGGDKFRTPKSRAKILRGEERGPKRDAVLLNAGAALFVAGKPNRWRKAGIWRAKRLTADGRTKNWRNLRVDFSAACFLWLRRLHFPWLLARRSADRDYAARFCRPAARRE